MEVKIVETYFLGTVKGKTTETLSLNSSESIKLDSKFDPGGHPLVTPKQPVSEFDAGKELSYKVVTSTPQIPTMFQPGIERGNRVLNVETELVYTDKVFTVDFPRPFAGTLSLTSDDDDGLTFDAQQYFSTIRGSYEEETLSTVNEFLESDVIPGATRSAVGTTVSLDGGTYKPLTRVVAFDRFDISECGWEARMQAFVEHHLGACNPPCETGVSLSHQYGEVSQPQQVMDDYHSGTITSFEELPPGDTVTAP